MLHGVIHWDKLQYALVRASEHFFWSFMSGFHTKEYLIPGLEKIPLSNSMLFKFTFIKMALPASYKTRNCKSVWTLREKCSGEQST